MTDQQELPEIRQARLERPSTPGQRVAGWAAWHAGELVAVLAPSALAVAVSPWAWVLTAASGGAWALHEGRHARARRSLSAEHAADIDAVTSTNEEVPTAEAGENEQTDEGEIEVRHG